MQKNLELTSKLVLAIVALAAVSALLVPTYAVPTIRSGDIFDGEVKTADLANGAVTNSKLATDAVTSNKIKNGEVKAEDIAAGVIPSGGGAIVLNPHEVKSDNTQLAPGAESTEHVDCPSGEVVTGGGFVLNGNITVRTSTPSNAEGTGWAVSARNDGTQNAVFNVYAICIDPTIP